MSLYFQTTIRPKLQSWEAAKSTIAGWQGLGQEVVLTNGCFDLLHLGHVQYLAEARSLGDKLVVALNSDASVARLKGPHRPIKDAENRGMVMASLQVVDLVVFFEEDTPYKLIDCLQPDVLVKGGDWAPEQIVGSGLVQARGGRVLSLTFVEGHSTTTLEQKIQRGQ